MIEFSAALILALEVQTTVMVAENKPGLQRNFANIKTHFFKTKVFNNTLRNFYSALKHSPRAIHF